MSYRSVFLLSIGLVLLSNNKVRSQVFGTEVPDLPQQLTMLCSFEDSSLLAVFDEPNIRQTREYWMRVGEDQWRELDTASALQNISRTARLLGHGSGLHSMWICLSTGEFDETKSANRMLQVFPTGEIRVRPSIPQVGPLDGRLEALFEHEKLGLLGVVRFSIDDGSSLYPRFSQANIFQFDGIQWKPLSTAPHFQSIDSVVGGRDFLHAAKITQNGHDKKVILYSGSEVTDIEKACEVIVSNNAYDVTLYSSTSPTLAAFSVRDDDELIHFVADLAANTIRRIDDVPDCRVATVAISDNTCLVMYATNDGLGFHAFTLDTGQGLSNAKLVEVLSKSITAESAHELGRIDGLFHSGKPVIYWRWVAAGI
jgi:hypothetical protein